jgi:hypothetical protein
MNSVQSWMTLRRQSSAIGGGDEVEVAPHLRAGDLGHDGRRRGSPALMAWAVVTIWLWPCWR